MLWDYENVVYASKQRWIQTAKKISTQVFTFENWRKQSKRKGQNWQIVKESCSTTTMRVTIHLHEIRDWFYSTTGMKLMVGMVNKTVKISTTMTQNRISLNFLLMRVNSSICKESWSYKKNEKTSNRMENIWQIKVHLLNKTKWALFHSKKPKLLSCQTNIFLLEKNSSKNSKYLVSILKIVVF